MCALNSFLSVLVSLRRTIYTMEEVLQAICGDFDVDEDTLGMSEDQDHQLGFYSHKLR